MGWIVAGLLGVGYLWPLIRPREYHHCELCGDGGEPGGVPVATVLMCQECFEEQQDALQVWRRERVQ